MTRDERVSLAIFASPHDPLGELPWPFPHPKRAIQWIGPCGSGKSTRLLYLAAQFPHAHYVYVTPERTCLPFPHAAVLIVDEADRMPRPLWRRVLATQSALILGTHRSLSRSLTRHRYAVQSYDTGSINNALHLCRVVNRRIEFCCLDNTAPLPILTPPDAARLVKKFGSDVRAIEAYLYQKVQAAECTGGRFYFVD